MGIFERLQAGLTKTRSQILSSIGVEGNAFGQDFYNSLEEALISADIGVDQSSDIIEMLKKEIPRQGIASASEAYACMKNCIAEGLTVYKLPDDFPPKPWVILVVGVNGVGKTTTIGKLAQEYKRQGKKVMLGAADTFRAGAIEQLGIWAQRTGADFISQHEGADPASVAFDALEAAKSRGIDVLILDTAGRLHNKVNLMNELEKMQRVLKRNTPHTPNEVLLVIDATTGQNALKQARVFHEALSLTGLIITKLDGTAKGGIALALTSILGIPIKKIGVGEGAEDLQDFNPRAYVDAMFGELGKA
jgi:fused signal recognition particle receptor